MINLDKENFWNELYDAYPKGMKIFCDWIDKYKKENYWNKLFNDHYNQSNIKRAANGEIYSIDYDYPKYHDLPLALQVGIFIQFASEQWRIETDFAFSTEGIHEYISNVICELDMNQPQ